MNQTLTARMGIQRFYLHRLHLDLCLIALCTFGLVSRDLAKKDRNGASDPFVRVRYNGKTYESAVRLCLYISDFICHTLRSVTDYHDPASSRWLKSPVTHGGMRVLSLSWTRRWLTLAFWVWRCGTGIWSAETTFWERWLYRHFLEHLEIWFRGFPHVLKLTFV